MQRLPFFWQNGLLSSDTLTVSGTSNTLFRGTGAFEGIRGYQIAHGTSIFRLDDHVKRFFSSMNAFGHGHAWSTEYVTKAIIDVVSANKCQEVYISPLFYLGGESIFIDAACTTPQLLIVAYDFSKRLNKPERLTVSTYERISNNAVPLDKKFTGTYINSMLAIRQAELNGFDDAIFLDAQGFIAESTHANIAFIQNNTIITPTTRSILPGITRKTVMQLAHDEGITLVEADILPEQVFGAEAGFMMGTLRGITPIAQVDNIPFDTAHPLIIKFIKLYEESVRGRINAYKDWVTQIHFQ